jgi:hypothetical protein
MTRENGVEPPRGQLFGTLDRMRQQDSESVVRHVLERSIEIVQIDKYVADTDYPQVRLLRRSTAGVGELHAPRLVLQANDAGPLEFPPQPLEIVRRPPAISAQHEVEHRIAQARVPPIVRSEHGEHTQLCLETA